MVSNQSGAWTPRAPWRRPQGGAFPGAHSLYKGSSVLGNLLLPGPPIAPCAEGGLFECSTQRIHLGRLEQPPRKAEGVLPPRAALLQVLIILIPLRPVVNDPEEPLPDVPLAGQDPPSSL